MSGFSLSPEHLRSLAKTHDDVSQDVNSLAPSMPGSVDGGDGAPYVADILASLGADAEALARLNNATASALRIVASNTARTDQDAANNLSNSGQGLTP